MSSTAGALKESTSLSRHFVSRESVAERLRGKRIALVGSAPTVLRNPPGLIDSHDVVCRVNNYKLTGAATGQRCDVHYSFYGTSIRKTRDELQRDGVTLCLCKCPDAKFMESEWHRRNRKEVGVDYRYIYRNRSVFWFCDTYVPSTEVFLEKFNLLGQHQPTTGVAALLDLLSFGCTVYATGFDFFRSGVHNVDEPWKAGKNPDDPIKHVPEREAQWLAQYAKNHPDQLTLDDALREIL